MFRHPELRELSPQETAAIHAETTIGELPMVLRELLPEAFETVTKAGVEPAGMPFVRYLEMTDDRVAIEVGVPVRRRFAATGRVHPYTLPGGTVAVGQHWGPYEAIGQSYDELGRWVGKQGRQPAGPMWEMYFTDPEAEPDPAKWRTDLFWPVR
jgi:effector-binding domain-containing protein